MIINSWTDKAEKNIYDWQGLQLHYCRLGQGPPIVLLHGLGLSHLEWEKNIETLTRYGTVYALDLPGFGASDKPLQALTSRELAEAAVAWAAGIGLEPGVWLGHSFGGEVALWVGALRPELAKGLILAATPGLPPKQDLPGLILNLLHDGPRELHQLENESPAQKLDFMLRVSIGYLQSGLTRMVQTLQNSDPAPLLQKVDRLEMPVLVIHGVKDPVVSLAESRETVACLPNARLCLLDAPHALNYTAADEFNASVAGFLDELLAEAATETEPQAENIAQLRPHAVDEHLPKAS